MFKLLSGNKEGEGETKVSKAPAAPAQVTTQAAAPAVAPVASAEVPKVISKEGETGPAGVATTAGPTQRSTKPQDFQIRVEVIEARGLPGAELNSLCRVLLGSDRKQTRTKRGTNNPYWNELFFFNVHRSSAELLDQAIDFNVFDAKSFRADSLIGSFKAECARVFEQPGHAVIRKWLALTDPQSLEAGVLGYVKVSIAILGPGDPVPSFKAPDFAEDDVEGNLWSPVGVQMRPAIFILRIYKGEDLPRMDPEGMQGFANLLGKKDPNASANLVDPYIKVNFAGKEFKTQIMKSTNHPEWNQEIKIPFQFPSMCRQLKISAWDWDQVGNDELIGNVVLNLDQISAQGDNGYLPSFGPSFLNIYGAPREFSNLEQFGHYNLGKKEGTAYRGRIFVELQTQFIEGDPPVPLAAIENEPLVRSQKYQRYRRYRLFVEFQSASMMKLDVDEPATLEVSMGNYGNMLDDTLPPSSSCTLPTHPESDGQYYYYLPWADYSKPCTMLESQFEYLPHRLELLNRLLGIRSRLTDNLAKANLGVKAEVDKAKLAELVMHGLEQLEVDLREVLAELSEEGAPPGLDLSAYVLDDLDNLFQSYRQECLAELLDKVLTLKNTATDVAATLAELEAFHKTLSLLAIEPQNSVPDLVVWLISGTKRIAYARIPAYQILYTENPKCRGELCGKVTTILLQPLVTNNEAKDLAAAVESGGPGPERAWRIPAMLRVRMFLAPERYAVTAFERLDLDSNVRVFADCFENQASLLGKWMDSGPLMTRPKFSDVAGRIELRKEMFQLPVGYVWDGEWETKLQEGPEAGREGGAFREEVYEHESRAPGGDWAPAAPHYTDKSNDEIESLDEMAIPSGWRWKDEAWRVDTRLACDEGGWQYAQDADAQAAYVSVEKMVHTHRRKRLMRVRVRTELAGALSPQVKASMKEGWEYATSFTGKFHVEEKKSDFVRRRRWVRYIKPIAQQTPSSPCFQVILEDKRTLIFAPSASIDYINLHRYQLRAFIFSARNLLPADQNGLSDPYVRLVIGNSSVTSRTLDETLTPVWDETFIIDSIMLPGDPANLKDALPSIVIECYDHDEIGQDDYLGRTRMVPDVLVLNSKASDRPRPYLRWFNFTRNGKPAGELLAAFELVLVDDPSNAPPDPPRHPKDASRFRVPDDVRPALQRTAIEVLCWGVRNMATYQLLTVNQPSVVFEIGGEQRQSSIIKNAKRNPNFDSPLLFFDVMLPKEALYMPPLNIKVRDQRAFGRHPVVGQHVLRNLDRFREVTEEARTIVETRPSKKRQNIMAPLIPAIKKQDFNINFMEGITEVFEAEPPKKKNGGRKSGKKKGTAERPEEAVDFWAKLYASLGEFDKCGKFFDKGYQTITVCQGPLENVTAWGEFTDFVNTFQLYRGTSTEEENEKVGELKAMFRLYPLPAEPQAPLPPRALERYPQETGPVECLVRVYALRAFQLQAKDLNGSSDPYLRLRIGDTEVDNRKDYLPNTLDPVFGRMFEMKCSIPLDKDLEIRVMDYNALLADEEIGHTKIDLENRLYSQHRATVGLSKDYSAGAPFPWRDSQKPRQILEGLAARYGWGKVAIEPVLDSKGATSDWKLTLLNRTYSLSDLDEAAKASRRKEARARARRERLAIQGGGQDGVDNLASSNTSLDTSVISSEDEAELALATDGDAGGALVQGAPEERLALRVMLDPSFPLELVTEHVETRPLFSALQEGIEQGKIQMWVDIFPLSFGTPGPVVDIAPRKPRKFELRVCMLNTVEVPLVETNVFGEPSVDIYVKAWIRGIDQPQQTDVHYNSVDGEGSFNWRFKFPFEYMLSERNIIVRKKEFFWSLDETVVAVPPQLIIEIWDNDLFSPDDFISRVELNLNRIPSPAKSAAYCTMDMLPDYIMNRDPNAKQSFFTNEWPYVRSCVPKYRYHPVDMFEARRLRGFWPCYSIDADGLTAIAGKVEMELEIITEEDAKTKVAGLGREEPNDNPKLLPPNRPEESFLAFASPVKTLRTVVWRRYKWHILLVVLIVLAVLFLALFIYSLPSAFANQFARRVM